MTDPPTTRWGLKAADWSDIRHIPAGEAEARKWAATFTVGSRRADSVAVTLYRDNGNGWEAIETFEATR